MIRGTQPTDAEALARISRESRFGAIPEYPDLHTPAEDLAFYRGQVEAQPSRVWVDRDGSVVGFVIWSGEFIDHLYVAPGHQRSGIGSRLLARAIADMAVPEVRLWTFQANAWAVAFYAKHGFRILAETDGSANEERMPDYLLGCPTAR